MDQVNQVVQFLKKHHFWVLTGLAMLVAVICWWFATSSIAASYEEGKERLEGQFRKMSDIVGIAQHPNDKVIAKINDDTKHLKSDVFDAWKALYKEQKELNQLSDKLNPEFRATFEKLGPDEPLPPRHLDTYLYFIRDHLPALKEIINWRHVPEILPGLVNYAGGGGEDGDEDSGSDSGSDDDSGGGGGGAAGNIYYQPMVVAGSGQPQPVGIVEWTDADRLAVEGRFVWPSRPNTLQVRLAQEDLWVYEALLRVIRSTNSGATDYYNAPVKRLDAMKIGQEAAEAWQTYRTSIIQLPVIVEEGEEYYEDDGGEDESSDDDSSGDEEGEGVTFTSAEQLAISLLNNRYIDDAGNPIPYGQPMPYAEFKMMPIMLRLLIDPQKIPRLLTECANSSMPIEVRVVRMNPGGAKPINLGDFVDLPSGDEDGDSGGGGGGGFGFGGQRAAAAQRSGPSTATVEVVKGLPPEEIMIEVYGIIYIFNPPDYAKLGTGAAATEGAGGAPAVEAPAAISEPTSTPVAPAASTGPETPVAPATETAPAAPAPSPSADTPAGTPVNGAPPAAPADTAAAVPAAPPAPNGAPSTVPAPVEGAPPPAASPAR